MIKSIVRVLTLTLNRFMFDFTWGSTSKIIGRILPLILFLPTFPVLSQSSSDSPDIWVGAYLVSWEHFAPPTGNWGSLPTSEIDWDAFTHLYYFALNAQEDGTLSEIKPYHNVSPDRINKIVAAAHRNSTPVLFTVGGWGNYEGFSKAISPEVRASFISNLISILTDWGFDGIDLDMEPIRDNDVENYKAFVRELHSELQKMNTPMRSSALLTVATSWKPSLFSELQSYFDQINLMTYDFSGAWEGWVSWHNSAVYSNGHTFPDNDKSLPSVDRMVEEFLDAGIESNKIGIGIDFYGYVWRGGAGTDTGGVTRPNQSWKNPPEVEDNVPYRTIMDNYYEDDLYRWDEKTGTVYLSIDRTGSADDLFISYEDEKAIQEKIKYCLENDLGGIFIWDLSGGYRENKPVGQRNLLLTFTNETVQNAYKIFQINNR